MPESIEEHDREWDPEEARLIKKYEVRYLSNVKKFDHTTRAAIYLYDNSGKIFGILRFKFDPSDVGPDKFVASTGVLHCNYPAESFSEVMDMLRNEKPLYLSWHSIDQYGTISTRKEPVGEEES